MHFMDAFSHPNLWYGDSYIDANPKTWALQQLGLGFTKAIVKHILAADSRIQDRSAVSYYKQRRRLDRFKAITLDTEVQPTPIIDSIPLLLQLMMHMPHPIPFSLILRIQ